MAEKKGRDKAGSSGRADERAPGPERRHDHLRPETPRPAPVTDIRSGEPRMPDEAGDVSIQNADDPDVVREDTGNTSTSSGTHPGDSGDDQRRKEQLRRGHRGISRMD